MLMHDIFHAKVPVDLAKSFARSKSTRTRKQHCFEIARPQTEIGRTSLRYRGPLSWNALPNQTKECKNRETFRRN